MIPAAWLLRLMRRSRIPAKGFFILEGIFLYLLSPALILSAKSDYAIVEDVIPAPNVSSGGTNELQCALLAFDAQDPGEKFPLLLALHPAGNTAKGYLRLWEEEAVRRRVMVAAPVLSRPYGNHPADLAEFHQLVVHIAEKYPVDREKIFLIGASAGALTAERLMIRYPSVWRGVVLIAAPPNHDLILESDTPIPPPLLWIHGQKDTQFRYAEVVHLFEKLKQRPGTEELWSDPQAGHEDKKEWHSVIWEWLRGKGLS